jgi:hypothetical protein
MKPTHVDCEGRVVGRWAWPFTIQENVAWDFIAVTDEAVAVARRADRICFGSLAQRCQPSRNTIQQLVAETPPDALRVFDINMRQRFYWRDVVEKSFRLGVSHGRDHSEAVGCIGHVQIRDENVKARGGKCISELPYSNMFVAYLLTRNIRYEEDLVDQLFNSSEKRLARSLLLRAHLGKGGNPEVVIPKISQETLAEMVGTTRSRVNFFMNRFKKLGFVRYNGGLEVHSSLLNIVLHD